jgi:hypothetical protein
MLAYGKLNRDMMSNGYVGCKLGFEFSGLLGGRRIMGVAKQAIATHVFARDYLVRAAPVLAPAPLDLISQGKGLLCNTADLAWSLAMHCCSMPGQAQCCLGAWRALTTGPPSPSSCHALLQHARACAMLTVHGIP